MKTENFIRSLKTYKLASLILVFVLLGQLSIFGSSHREAPLIANDPLADNVDVYAFRSPDNQDMMTLIATYVPLQAPHGGPNYYSFGEHIAYDIHIDNDASKPGDEIIYRFLFSKENEDPTTFFNIRLGKQNLKTTYRMLKSENNGRSWKTIIYNGVVPPNNIGKRSIEGPVGLNERYSQLMSKAIETTDEGEVVFAGPTDDPFFVDLGGIFDLGNAKRQDGPSRDGVACLNVSTIAIQVPIKMLLKDGVGEAKNILDADYVIGVWASASRRKIRTLGAGGTESHKGPWVQVSRLGMPLTNEVVIPIGMKDYWNAITPHEELADGLLDDFFFNPELGLYMDDDLFGGAVPAFSALRIQRNSLQGFDFGNGQDGLFPLKGSEAVKGTALDDDVFGTLLLPGPGQPRSVDLWPAFHTGVPNFPPYQLATGKGGNPLAEGKPFVNNFLPNGGDMLRVNMAVPSTDRNDPSFSSLGLIQAAVLGLTDPIYNGSADLEFIPNMDGFPNGRRLEDDVTRIELQAVSGVVLAAIGLWYDDYLAGDANPVTQDLLDVITYTTGVESNDAPFRNVFPYVASPWSGDGKCGGAISNSSDQSGGNGTNRDQIHVSSNANGDITTYDLSDGSSKTIETFSFAAEGIYYAPATDLVVQASRTNNRLEGYFNASKIEDGAKAFVTAKSAKVLNSPREIAVKGNKYVVADNGTNQFFVFTRNRKKFTLDHIFDIPFDVWGITFIGSNLYAVVDKSSDLAVFRNFLSNNVNATLNPDKRVTIEGIVRTHGLDYAAGTMVMTDIGEASNNKDGGFHIIRNFLNQFDTTPDGGMIPLTAQTRVAGPATSLGNPIDVAYVPTVDAVYISEIANGGGRVLGFTQIGSGGDITPSFNKLLAGASSIFYAVKESPSKGREAINASMNEIEIQEISERSKNFDLSGNDPLDSDLIQIYPQPASHTLNMKIDSAEELEGSVQFRNMNGQVVLTENISLFKGQNNLSIDINQLPANMYVITIPLAGGKSLSKRVSIQK